MSTVAQISGDRQYLYLPAASYTTYSTYVTAQVAAIAASIVIGGGAAVLTAQVLATVTATGKGNACRVDLPGSGLSLWVIQQSSSAPIVIPYSDAIADAETYSLANANASVYVCRVFQSCTGP